MKAETSRIPGRRNVQKNVDLKTSSEQPYWETYKLMGDMLKWIFREIGSVDMKV
jgi:hypothetical protein